MAEYSLSATLRARDSGFTSTIRRAQREAQRLENTAGKIKSEQDLRLKVGVEGMTRIERLRGAIEAARNNSNKPLSVRLRDQATQQLSKIRAEVNSLTSKAHQVVVNVKTNGAEKLGKIKNSISEGVGGAAMAAGATMLGTAGIGYGVVNAVQSQMNFEKQMSSVKAIMSGSLSGAALETEMQKLTALAEKMGATTKFTAKEAGEALYYMGMAGWDSQKMISGLPAVLNLAAAGNVDLATTSDIVTDSMTGFGLKAGQMVKNSKGQLVESSKHYADVMAALVTNANTDIPMLGETLKYAAANVGAMYANGNNEDRMRGAEDMMLVAGLMANAGIKSSQSGTAARALFARLGSQNRNASFALNALGVDFVDKDTGEVRRMRDVFQDLRNRFKEGVDPEHLINFAEELEGTKLHADTRRKLEGFIANAQKNGGKLGGGEMLKMAAMLNGQEGMSALLATVLASEKDWNKLANAIDNADGAAERMAEIQLDNLAGSVTLLGSAWDAFQRSFVKGAAGEGLRSFVDSITDSLSKANDLFKDGIDFSDLVTLGADAVTKLKNKFLELDGIGSLLAGGALFWGLKKIASMALSVKDTLGTLTKARTMSDIGNVIRGNKTAGGLPSTTGAMNVTASTMNVRAGVVNVSGAVKGGGVQAGAAGGKGATVLTNQQRVNDYYARRQQILTSGTTVAGGIGAAGAGAAAQGGKLAALSSARGVIGGAGLMAGIFGVMDVISTRANSNYTNQAANDKLAEAKAHLDELKNSNANIEQINDQIAAIRVAEQNVRDTAELNRLEERRTNAGAVGMVGGAMAGAAIGSVVPIIGTTIGGLIGGILGQYGGFALADNLKEVKRTNNSLTSADSVKNPDLAILQIGEAQRRRRDKDIAEREKPSYEQQQVDSAIKTSAGASKRRRDADIAERNGTAQVAKESARLQNIAKQREENAKNFGYSTLGQDYSANATPIMATQRLTAEERSLQQQRQRLSGIIGEQPAAPTRQDFRQPLTTATGYTPAQIYRNDNENAFNISRWFDSLKAKFSGETATPQERNFSQPLAAATAFTATQTPVQNNFDFDAFKSRFVGTETKNLAQPLAANAAYVPNATPYQNLDKSAFNLSKTFDNLKVQFSGAEKSVQERNFAQPLASTQAQVQAQQPTLNLNQDAFNISAAISSLRERFSSPDIAPQDRNYNFNQPMANAPNLNANVPPMGLPNVELPEFNIAEKLSTEFDTISQMATTAWESLTTGASTAFESLSTSIGNGLESAKMTLSTFGEEMSMSLSSGIESLQMSLSTLGTDISTSFGTAFEGISVMASTTFSSLSATISGGVEAARATITTAFQSAATEVQGVWNAMPGFFSGIFGGLGGIASAAGAAIAAGINSGIGMIMSAWDALSGWLSAKIASLSSMASSAVGAIASIGGNATGTAYWQGGLTQVNEHGGELIILPSGKQILPYQTTQVVMKETKIAHNAKGTSFFEGGWSEVNEHGGELMYLPTGTQIIPHATTVRILREQIKEKLNDNRHGYANGLAQSGTYGQNVSSVAGTFEPRFAGLEQGKTSSAAGFNNNVLSINNRIRKENATPSALRGVSVNENGTGFFKQQQRQNSALPALEVNAESNNLRRYENRQSITTNRRFENSTAFNDIQSGLSITHNYTGTSYFKGGLTTVNEHGGEIIALPDGRNILPQYTFQNVFKDSLGNLQGVNIPEYNRITADDSAAVRRAKQDAQYKQLLAQSAVYNSSIKSNQFNRASNIQTATANENTVSSEVNKIDGSPFGFRDRTVFNPNAEPSQTSQPPFTRKNRRGIFGILGDIFNPRPRQSRGGVTITRGGIFNRRIPNWNPTISTPPTFPTQQKTPNTMSDIGRRKNRGGIFGGLFDVYKRPTDWILNAASGNVLNSVNSFSSDNQLNQLEQLNSFNEGQLGTLPAPEIKSPQAAEPSSKNSTSNNTTNTNSSKVSFNFGDVNINNTANFDEFAHRLITLFIQGTSNSVQN